MSDAKRCAECGRELVPGAQEGLCPACLLVHGLETQPGGGTGAALSTPPSPEELANYFPQLEILELLGRGGMGVVYKARQRNLDRLVALKILAAPSEGDPAFAERFAREAVALARLGHPHIVTVHDLGRAEGGLYYFIMEYVDGVNVRQLLNTAQITPDEALAIVPQVCEALQYAHEQGIVHRDIKPENILIDKGGRVKIADFGIAKIVGREAGITLTSSGATMGTPSYMAPEQIEHPQEVDHRADIYSLGVVFYQMLTGELPMGRFAPPSKKVRVDVRLDEVVLRALEKEPDLRWQQAADVKTEVETIVSTPPPGGASAQVEQAAGSAGGRTSKNKNRAWLFAAALVLIAAAGAIAAYEFGHKGALKWAGGTLVAPQSPPPATAPAPAQPEATPSAAPAPAPAPQEPQGTVALLLSGKWNIMGKVDHEIWYVAEFRPDRSVLITEADGTQETREWTMDGSVISIIYSNHHDIFYPPLDPAGTSGQGRTQGFIATRIKDTEEGLLFSGAWQFTGMNVSATRVFNSDGSFATNGDATASGKWWAETDKIVMAFQDGHTETLELPLNPKGTAGTDREGNAMIASLQKAAASASPSPPAPSASVPDEVTAKMLVSAAWKVTSYNWTRLRVFHENHTFETDSHATENGTWQIRNGHIELNYQDGHMDAFTLPLNPKGTAGVNTQGYPTISYLLASDSLTATSTPVGGPTPVPGNFSTEASIATLTGGPWRSWGTDWASVFVFSKDGSFLTDNMEHGKWQVAGGFLELLFDDGHKDMLALPVNEWGTPGTDAKGFTLMMYRYETIKNSQMRLLNGDLVAVPTPAMEQPSVAPTAGAPPANPEGNDQITLLLAGRWYFFGASWSAIRTFYENGTFASEPRADETGKWKRRDGAIDLLFNNGNHDAFLLPMDAKGTLGVDTHGFPCIAYLLGPAPEGRPEATPSPAPAAADIPEEATTSLLVSGPWRMWGKNWSARRTFRRNGSFFSDNDSSGGRGKWKIASGNIELSFEDGHKDILQLPLNPAGTRGVGGADSLGYVAFLVDSKGINPVSQVVAPGTPQEAATIKMLTSGQWVVRSQTGGSGYLLRTLNADGTFSDHATSVNPDKEPGLVQQGKWRINGDSVEMSLSDVNKYTFALPLNPRGTPGQHNEFRSEPQLTIAYLPSATGSVPIKSVLTENGMPIMPQPGAPEESTIAVNDSGGALMSGTWSVTGINWQAALGTLSPNGGFVSRTSYTNGTTAEENGTWRLNTQVEFWIVFENGRKCVFPLPLDWKKSYGMSSDGYAVMLCSQGEPVTVTKAKELKGLEETQMPADEVERTTKMLTGGTWKYSGGNWEAIRTFRPGGSFTSVEKGAGAYFFDKEMTVIGWWKIVGETIQLNAVWGKEIMKLPLDPGGTHGVDYKGGAMFSYKISGTPQPAAPARTAVPQKLSPLNPAPPPSGPVRDTPPRRQSTPQPSPWNVNANN